MSPPQHRGASRRRRRAAVLPASSRDPERAAPPLTVITGTVLDASPHLLILSASRQDGPAPGEIEIRLAMGDGTTVRHGGRGGLAALRPGRSVVVRLGEARLSADRIWVDISRVTGTIVACRGATVEVDMGPHRGRTHVVIPPHAFERVLVRHPRLEPGYLIDLICVRSPDGPRAVRPGTSQPGYRPDDLAPPDVAAPVPDVLRGTATWFAGAGGGTPDGAAYPAVDSEGDAGGCADAPSGCVPFPYLSLGSDITVRNECTGRATSVPVVECGCVAARYCDRCVECDTSPRGRIVELTPAAFVGLGGELDTGCFNAAVRTGAPLAMPGGAVSGGAVSW
ncbi:hypothetical protein [Actinomadura livida]|uniref:Uncharacterized protein n=1 Tax=Actinomadura livida TaxID=79909 RepID=A0A7W7MVD9_9ACTN|nr:MULTISPECIES: hypothetical protein [Actinomadura]MBB4771664.1 hypothetical protein [Actinomadura catellatispora]GGU01706.1 hypothetical protein GCM10010208_26860 [Actinomadura livida]